MIAETECSAKIGFFSSLIIALFVGSFMNFVPQIEVFPLKGDVKMSDYQTSIYIIYIIYCIG